MRLLDSIRSMVAGLRAGSALGRASRKRRKGQLPEALAIAQKGLSFLRHTYVQRNDPSEGTAHATLTVLAESLARELNAPGVSEQDLTDALTLLGGSTQKTRHQRCASTSPSWSHASQLHKPMLISVMVAKLSDEQCVIAPHLQLVNHAVFFRNAP